MQLGSQVMKQSTAVQMLGWVNEFKRLQAKRLRGTISHRETFRLEELQARLKDHLARRQLQAEIRAKSQPSATPENTPQPVLRDTGAQAQFVRKQAIVTKHDSFSALPFVAMRNAQQEQGEGQVDTSEHDSHPGTPQPLDKAPQAQAGHPYQEASQERVTRNADDITGEFAPFELFPPETLK